MPIARIRIGSDMFVSGDGVLMGASVTLSEDARASTCSFSTYDKGLKLAGKYFKNSYVTGGIEVPTNLLSAPAPEGSQGSGAGGSATGVTSGSFTPGQQANEANILAECARQGVTDPSHVAYILATAWHESDKFNTLEEYADGSAYEGWPELGNTEPGDGPRFKGRGYVQLTGRVNYEKYAELTGQPIVDNPELVAEDAGMAAFVLVHGSKTGHFTGVGLDDFGSHPNFDFVGARAIINGSDKASMIAGYASDYLARIESGELAIGTASPPPPEPPPPAEPAVVDAAKPGDETSDEEKKQSATPKESPANNKGREIIIEFGFRADQLTAYHFIHIGTDASGRAPDTCSFSGKSIRWEMSRRTVNCTWQDVTLREVAEDVCERYGRSLDMEGDGPTYAHLDATGITYLDLLFRECRAIGYRMFDDGGTLQLRPWRPGFVGFVITPEMQSKFSFSDKATGDKHATPGANTSPDQPETTAADTKLELNAATGEISQVNPEDSTGTGSGGDTAAVTGTGTPAMSGSTKPAGSGGGAGGTLQAAAGAIAEQLNPLPDNPLPINSLLPETITGLPSQQVGTIDLADGTATGEEIRDESRRVKSYESSATIVTTPAALRLAPGSVIAIAEACFDNDDARAAFAKEWRVSSVTHSLQSGKLETQLSFYTPQAQKPPGEDAPAIGASSGGETSTTVEGCTVIQGVPFINQRENAQNPSGSCNVTSLAMCLEFMGITGKNPSKRFPDELQDALEAQGLSRHSSAHLALIAGDYGVNANFDPAFSYDRIKQNIDAGKPMVGAAYFTAGDHIVCITGYCPDASGNIEAIICNDPWGDWNTGYSNHAGTSVKYARSKMESIAFSDGDMWVIEFP